MENRKPLVKKLVPFVVAGALLASLGARSSGAEEKTPPPFQRLIAVTHIHSLISPHGRASLQAIASLAAKRNIDVLIPTDRFLERWEYGLPPLSGLFRMSLYRTCVLKFGPQKYLNILDKIRRDHPSLLIIPGLETPISYYWTGHPAKGNLTLHDPQRHLLVLGLSRAEDMESLPVLSHPRLGAVDWKRLILPALTAAAGLALMIRWPAGLLVVVLGLGWGINQRPFRRLPDAFSLYTRNGYDAAQILINRVNARGGLTVWAHPEAINFAKPQKFFRSVSMQTSPYPESVLETRDYTGFAYFWEGTRAVGAPGGLWDQALREYAEGRRARPPWAFAELDWSEEGRAGLTLDKAQNVLWVREKTEAAVLEAFRAGRFYAAIQEPGHEVFLETWRVQTPAAAAVSGEKIPWTPGAALVVSLRGPASPEKPHIRRVTLVRNGQIWREYEDAGGGERTFPLPAPEGSMDFYRLFLKEESFSFIASNPIFVARQKP